MATITPSVFNNPSVTNTGISTPVLDSLGIPGFGIGGIYSNLNPTVSTKADTPTSNAGGQVVADRDENAFKVRLTSAGGDRNTVSFDASPEVSESRTVNYNSLEPLHAPGQIQVYKNTASRNYQITSVKMISRTTEEADRNLKNLWILRSWCMPRFGNSSTLSVDDRVNRRNREKGKAPTFDKLAGAQTYYGTELLGAPPPILYFSAYSKSVNVAKKQNNKKGVGTSTNVWTIAQHINRVPVVIQQLTIPYPNDIDYITSSGGVPMPIIMNLDITLIETHSPNSYEGFSLDNFKKGILQGF